MDFRTPPTPSETTSAEDARALAARGCPSGSNPGHVGPTPPPEGIVYTSSTHRKEYMQFTRWGKGNDIAKFPECSKLFVGGAKDKNKLFTEWMKSNKNPDAVEGALKILASQKREGTCKSELLTVRQMREKGLSE